MDSWMLNISLNDRVWNQLNWRKIGVTDAVKRIMTLKWSWAVYVAIVRDGRWIKKIWKQRPIRDPYRNRVRPPTIWSDEIKPIPHNWIETEGMDQKVWNYKIITERLMSSTEIKTATDNMENFLKQEVCSRVIIKWQNFVAKLCVCDDSSRYQLSVKFRFCSNSVEIFKQQF